MILKLIKEYKIFKITYTKIDFFFQIEDNPRKSNDN